MPNVFRTPCRINFSTIISAFQVNFDDFLHIILAISPNKQPILPLFFSQPPKKHNSINFLNLRIIFAHMKILKKEYK